MTTENQAPEGAPAQTFTEWSAAWINTRGYPPAAHEVYAALAAQPKPAASTADTRCAACDKPAVTSSGMFPTCPCGSKAFNAVIGYAAPPAQCAAEGDVVARFFHQVIHGDFAADNPDDLRLALAARAAVSATQPKGATLPDMPDSFFAGMDEDYRREAWRIRQGVKQSLQAPAPAPEPSVPFEDPRVQTVYSILANSEDVPPPEQHWEGWAARRIVDALATQGPAVKEQP